MKRIKKHLFVEFPALIGESSMFQVTKLEKIVFFVQKYASSRLRYYLQLNLPRQNNRVTQKKLRQKVKQ